MIIIIIRIRLLELLSSSLLLLCIHCYSLLLLLLLGLLGLLFIVFFHRAWSVFLSSADMSFIRIPASRRHRFPPTTSQGNLAWISKPETAPRRPQSCLFHVNVQILRHACDPAVNQRSTCMVNPSCPIPVWYSQKRTTRDREDKQSLGRLQTFAEMVGSRWRPVL